MSLRKKYVHILNNLNFKGSVLFQTGEDMITITENLKGWYRVLNKGFNAKPL